MKAYADQISELSLIGVILEYESEDVLSEIDEEYHRECGEIDINDPRLISETIEINPEGDFYKPQPDIFFR